jgi:outer membrane protein assembly factor BamB
MMSNKIIIIFVFSLLLLQCKNKSNSMLLNPITPIDTTKTFEQKWQSFILTSKIDLVGSDVNLVYKNLFITTGDYKKTATLYAWNTKTGLKEWEWISPDLEDIDYLEIKGNILLANTLREVFAFNLDTRQIIWEENIKNQGFNADNGMTVTDKDIYVTWNTYKDWGLFPKDSVAIFKYDINTGNKEKIFGFGLEEGKWEPSVSEVCFWQDPITKDSILLFNKDGSNAHTSPQEQPTDFYAINIRTKNVLWRQEKYCPISSNMVHAPVVYDNDVIISGDWSIYSFDIPTGKLNWRRQFPQLGNFGSFGSTQNLLVNDRLFINPVGFDVMCLNAKNGEIVWHNTTDAPNCTPLMHYYKDMLVYTSWAFESVMVLDALNGKLIHKQPPPDKSTFYANMAYDPLTDMFFTYTFKSVYGFKINKPK